MSWLDRLLAGFPARRTETLREVQQKFSVFRDLLESHNSTLKLISRLESSRQSLRYADIFTLWKEIIEIRDGVGGTIQGMIALGGEKYAPLLTQLVSIWQGVERMLPLGAPVTKDVYTIPVSSLGMGRAISVGTKSANLGELKTQLKLPIPEGFAISAWAYRHFLESNQLQEKIHRLLKDVTIRSYHDLEIISDDIRDAIVRKPVPEDLASSIYQAFDELAARTGKSGFALRSSAVGEDTSFSFAGQYLSVLNVRREALLDTYKQIVASKFTPSAIFYLLSRSLTDIDFSMGVLCMEMVDAVSSGVVYTLDPLQPEKNQLVVSSVFGLGSYLVDGTVTPDVYYVSRDNNQTVSSHAAFKRVQLILSEVGELKNAPVPAAYQQCSSLDQDHLLQLTSWALQIEEHFGGAQDIEWALDRSGQLVLLQTRPLIFPKTRSVVAIPQEYQSLQLMEGGTPICSGIGIGPVFHLASVKDLDLVPDGSILVAANPSPYLVAAMHRINGLVTMVGGSTSHLATLARELDLPTVVGLADAANLVAGQVITLDASQGVIYEGSHPEWQTDSQEPNQSAALLTSSREADGLISAIVHLNVIHPSDPEFTPENCRTPHDILRFIHQKSMDEIFTVLKQTTNKDKIGLRLKTKIPLAINIIYLDRDIAALPNARSVPELEIQSLPMQALWGGIMLEGWPETQIPADLKGFVAVVGANIQEGHTEEFSENSYAFLSREYMLLNLRMGYHFSTIEALATKEPEKNYIRMQFKLGGAPLERRVRRVWLISELLLMMGFENSSQGDFLDSTIAYQPEEGILQRLQLLGRITILTKQLDMALSNDARTRSYLNAFAQKLNLTRPGETSSGDENHR